MPSTQRQGKKSRPVVCSGEQKQAALALCAFIRRVRARHRSDSAARPAEAAGSAQPGP